jgi:hypothetical protein
VKRKREASLKRKKVKRLFVKSVPKNKKSSIFVIFRATSRKNEIEDFCFLGKKKARSEFKEEESEKKARSVTGGLGEIFCVNC